MPEQGFNKLRCGAVADALGRHPLAVLILPSVIGDVSYMVIRVKEGLQIQDQVFCRLPGRYRIRLAVTVIFDYVIPCHTPVCAGKGSPSAILCHLDDSRAGDGRIAAAKRVPAPGTFAGMIALCITAAPFIPNAQVITLRLQCHADPDPFVMSQISTGNAVQGRKYIVHIESPIMVCMRTHSVRKECASC